jgi:hypothetical protein
MPDDLRHNGRSEKRSLMWLVQVVAAHRIDRSELLIAGADGLLLNKTFIFLARRVLAQLL